MKTYTATQIASAVGRHPATITRWAKAKKIPYLQDCSGRMRFTEAGMQAALKCAGFFTEGGAAHV